MRISYKFLKSNHEKIPLDYPSQKSSKGKLTLFLNKLRDVANVKISLIDILYEFLF